MIQHEIVSDRFHFVLHRSEAGPMFMYDSQNYVRFTLYAIADGHGEVVKSWPARFHWEDEKEIESNIRIIGFSKKKRARHWNEWKLVIGLPPDPNPFERWRPVLHPLSEHISGAG